MIAGRWGANHASRTGGGGGGRPGPISIGLNRATSISPRTTVTPPPPVLLSYISQPCNGLSRPKGLKR